MEIIRLRRDLDRLGVDNSSRPQAAPRDDLLDRAAMLEQRAISLDIAEFIACALLRKADILFALNRHDDTLEALTAARSALGRLRESDLLAFILTKQAEALACMNDWTRVNDICAEGISLVEQFRFKITPQYAQSAYLRPRISLYTLGVRAAYEIGQPDLALGRAELAKCRSVSRYQAQDKDEAPSHSDDVEPEFRKVCQQIDAAQKSPGGASEALRNKRRALWDLLTIQRFQSRGVDTLPEFSVTAVQDALGSNDAVIYYFRIDAETLLTCVLNRDEFVIDMLPFPPAAQTALEEYIRESSQSGEGNLGLLARFLWPKRDHLLWNKSRLFISPHQLLHAVPFHALPFNGDFLIKTFAVGYIPNLSSLLLKGRRPAKPKVLAVGITDYHVDGVILRRLPDAEIEAHEVQDTHQGRGIHVDLLSGSEASEERLLLRDMGEYTCLHFATHGQNVESDTPMESYMYLVDSKLEAIEIANWRLRADLVVLSACSSGQRAIRGRGMNQLPGDDLLGLQAAFFAAGARRVLCCLWPVGSKAARTIMVAFHGFLAGGMEAEFALQAAIKQYLGGARILRREPSYWAPFFLALVGSPSFQE